MKRYVYAAMKKRPWCKIGGPKYKAYNHAVCSEYYSTQANKHGKGSNGHSKEKRKLKKT